MSIESAISNLREAISGINVFRSPWEVINFSGVDKLGEYTIADPNLGEAGGERYNKYPRYYSFELILNHYQLSYSPVITFYNQECRIYLDLSGKGRVEEISLDLKAENKDIIINPARLIFPDTLHFPSSAGSRPDSLIKFLVYKGAGSDAIIKRGLWGGLFLPRIILNPYSDWIVSTINYKIGEELTEGVTVDAYDGVNYDLYLEKINISTSSLRNLINRLKDNSDISIINQKVFSIGSSNIAKLTTEERDMIYAKGWGLQ